MNIKYTLLVLLIVVSSCNYNFNKNVKFGVITWEYIGGKKCVSVLKKDGKVILGPHNITLWAKYPYIVGEYILPGATTYYLIDIRSQTTQYFKKFQEIRDKYPIDFGPSEFVTFQDLKGQWAKPEKLRALRKSIQNTLVK